MFRVFRPLLGGALLASVAWSQARAPAPLDLAAIPPEPTLDGQAIARALVEGDVGTARRLAASWRFRRPQGPPPPVVPLTAVLYQLSLGHREVVAGPLVLRTPPRAAPLSDAMQRQLVEGYVELSHRLLGVDPPPVRVHIVDSLPGALHGIHLVGHVVVERDGLPEVFFHELAHFLLQHHPGGRRLGMEVPWLEEGLCEWVSFRRDPRLAKAPPICDRLPASPVELFPSPDLARAPGADPGAAYLPAAYAAGLVDGGPSPFRERIPQLLRRLADGQPVEDALRAVTGVDLATFAARWRRTLGVACLPEALTRSHGLVRARLGYVDAVLRGDPAGSVRGLAAAAELVPGEGVPPWMVQDAIQLGGRLVGRPDTEAALGELARAIPWAGLAIPGAFQDEAWSEPLARLLAAAPPPRALLYLTLMLWNTPHRQAVQDAWTQGFALHGEDTEWLQAAVLHAAFVGRLDPPPEAPYARVSQRLESIARKLAGRTDRAPDLAEGVAEARAAYAFGSGNYAIAEEVLESELAEAGWDWRRALNLAACRYRRGDGAGAEDAYRRALMLAPDHPALRVGLAQVALEGKRWDEAAALLADLDPAGEDGYRILEGRARIAEARQQADEAARWRAEMEKVEEPPSDSPVPALFQVMVFTPLDKLVADLAGGER